jgi:KDO2-lipid IV(A) lauroyltransferase
MPKGVPQVIVSFKVDVDGILSVSAKEQISGVETEIEIRPTYNLAHKDIRKMFEDAMKNGCFGITAHFGNWEIMQRYSNIIGTDLSVIYNPLQNPYTNKFYLSQRKVRQLPKGSNAMKQLIEVIRAKKNVGILIDQRDKTGEIFQFLGRDARTSTAIQRLALKYDYKVMSVKCMRRKDNPNKFILEVYPSIEIEKTGDFETDVKAFTNKTLELLEDWIRKDPENWLLWFYSRWRTKF